MIKWQYNLQNNSLGMYRKLFSKLLHKVVQEIKNDCALCAKPIPHHRDYERTS